jgi:hypothetical protein
MAGIDDLSDFAMTDGIWYLISFEKPPQLKKPSESRANIQLAVAVSSPSAYGFFLFVVFFLFFGKGSSL